MALRWTLPPKYLGSKVKSRIDGIETLRLILYCEGVPIFPCSKVKSRIDGIETSNFPLPIITARPSIL